jgi:HPt (histidine-containing phosphotransfer) domain-containing protein
VIARLAALAYARAEAYAKDIDSLNQNLLQEVAQRKELNASLEIKVNERTAEIRSLLQHIPQGILTIGEGGLIGPNYSSHVHDIIPGSPIAHRSFKDLVLDQTQLSPDVIDRAWQTILACMGEDGLTFDMNADNLPVEFGYKGHREIELKCTWNVELDSHHKVRRILVTLLDITSEVVSRKKLVEKNMEFQIVRQLIDIGPRKSRQFMSSCRDLLAENARLLRHPDIDLESIKILFVNTHTLKGSARTLQLTGIANVLHAAEGYYADILRQGAAIQRDRLEQDFAAASHTFQQYETVHRHILGHSEDERRLAIDRSFLEDHSQMLRFLCHDGILNASMKKVLRESTDRLLRSIFISLPTVLEDIFMQASRIAKDLDKEAPLIRVHMETIMISHKQELAVRNAFIHLLRNSLDHGIEKAEQRRARGKDARGCITVSAEHADGGIMLRYGDDGAGLAIGQLRKKGLETRLLSPQASLQNIADLVFHQGMSTSSSLSMISGRGVGMDAVRRFIEGEGGEIQLHLDELLDAERETYRFHLIIRMPDRCAWQQQDFAARFAG